MIFNFYVYNKSKKIPLSKGFTLAEVLITLAIIGIVASLTIPSLISKTGDQETTVKVKKLYSSLSSATDMINKDCYGSILNCLSNPNAGDNDATTRNEIVALYKNTMNITKDCGVDSGCFADGMYKELQGNNFYELNNNGLINKFILNSNASIYIDWQAGGVGPEWGKITILADINGTKGPNTIGKDCFIFIYNPTTNKIEPYGVNEGASSCQATLQGYSCAKEIIIEGSITY